MRLFPELKTDNQLLAMLFVNHDSSKNSSFAVNLMKQCLQSHPDNEGNDSGN